MVKSWTVLVFAGRGSVAGRLGLREAWRVLAFFGEREERERRRRRRRIFFGSAMRPCLVVPCCGNKNGVSSKAKMTAQGLILAHQAEMVSGLAFMTRPGRFFKQECLVTDADAPEQRAIIGPAKVIS